MLKPTYTNQFKKDLKLMLRRGKDKSKIKDVMITLIDEKQLKQKFKDHILIGDFHNRRECHIESDWLLVYIVETNRIIFERTGTYSDLFK